MNLHVAQVSDQVLLLITFTHEVPVGKVRLYTQRSIHVLQRILADDPDADHRVVVDDAFELGVGHEIDAVFRERRYD